MFAAGLLMFRGGRMQLDPLADPLMRGLRHDARYTDLLMKNRFATVDLIEPDESASNEGESNPTFRPWQSN